jgi:hypothetical protein
VENALTKKFTHVELCSPVTSPASQHSSSPGHLSLQGEGGGGVGVGTPHMVIVSGCLRRSNGLLVVFPW